MNSDIELHIDELILHGIPPGDTYRIGLAVRAELTRLLQMHGLPSALSKGAEFAEITAGQFNMPANLRPTAIGNQVAGSVFKGLNKTHL